MNAQIPSIGDLLRLWRQRRHLSQLDLASDAEISAKHLSFLETGRAQPSREMLLRLAERLGIPLRERNVLLVAAGYAPVFPERALDDPALQAARRAIDLVLAGHAPHPALAVDRHWNMVAANRSIPPLLGGVSDALLRPPVNVLRLSLHPEGLAPRIANLAEWRAHLLARLRHQIEISADPTLAALLDEIRTYPAGGSRQGAAIGSRAQSDVAIPFQLRTDSETLTFFSTTMMFGTPIDITLSELAIESFFPANPATAAAMRRLAERPGDEA